MKFARSTMGSCFRRQLAVLVRIHTTSYARLVCDKVVGPKPDHSPTACYGQQGDQAPCRHMHHRRPLPQSRWFIRTPWTPPAYGPVPHGKALLCNHDNSSKLLSTFVDSGVTNLVLATSRAWKACVLWSDILHNITVNAVVHCLLMLLTPQCSTFPYFNNTSPTLIILHHKLWEYSCTMC